MPLPVSRAFARALAFKPVVRPVACQPVNRLCLLRQLVIPARLNVASAHNGDAADAAAALPPPLPASTRVEVHLEISSAVQRDPAGIAAAFARLADVEPVRLPEGTGVPFAGPNIHARPAVLREEMMEYVLPAVRAVEAVAAVPEFAAHQVGTGQVHWRLPSSVPGP